MISVMKIAVAVGVAACTALPTSQAAKFEQKPVLRVLVVTGGHGFERDPFFAMFKEMDGVTFREAVQPAANDLYTREAARSYDVLVLYDMVQEISEEQKRSLVRLLKEDGKGLVGLHHSLCSYQNWPEYRRILGGQYYMAKTVAEGVTYEAATYDHDQKFRVQVADAKHPITRGMKDFDIDDETYKGFYVNTGVKELLRVEYPKSAPVVGWAHQYGKARVAYLQLGHGPTAFANPNYRQMVRNAIFWAARRDRNR